MGQRRSKCVRTTGGVVLAGALLSTGVLASPDGKRMPGTMCDFVDDNGESVDRGAGPKFQNRSGSQKSVACPVIQDIIDGDVEYAEIVASATIDEDTCRFYVRYPNGNYYSYTHDDVVSAGGDYNKTRWWNGSSKLSPYSGGTYTIKCTLPANAVVLSYKVDEE